MSTITIVRVFNPLVNSLRNKSLLNNVLIGQVKVKQRLVKGVIKNVTFFKVTEELRVLIFNCLGEIFLIS
jgi:hypothetical protein